MPKGHREPHRLSSVGWLRAAVLGANDGIVSTASLIIGVASAHSSHGNLLLTGVAGLIAGAMSMATGEYVSVSSQADTEKAALAEERAELDNDGPREHRELAAIYERRGLEKALARQVADALMARDALGAHARDELGITEITTARPLQAAASSACSFAVGAALPLFVAAVFPGQLIMPGIAAASLVSLAVLGGVAARVGGARIVPGMLRVTFWSALSMGVASGVGNLFNAL
ncbi:VIT1/CCC1 transporter family protein [Paraburkholderia bryophila]|uniref:VIT1/CCC1 family predicted Fe2+/Mn2+ transporter n=1 Tax=Paraburkholderia bryophila TaxID=420952 RepID=A0A7Y9WIV0_9BURK|nr:VIT family protein [Paraburkholderia bryophila]NYH19914.1 VIT1/CCC1 family predicted Fe2+/Mn2+ transporter [Paraburkholderia bryophila]NYH21058.1 VIT1/CCC1 family predicted Fe2+/Mn2+ transporter [Paraburkholderia bryophila]